MSFGLIFDLRQFQTDQEMFYSLLISVQNWSRLITVALYLCPERISQYHIRAYFWSRFRNLNMNMKIWRQNFFIWECFWFKELFGSWWIFIRMEFWSIVCNVYNWRSVILILNFISLILLLFRLWAVMDSWPLRVLVFQLPLEGVWLFPFTLATDMWPFKPGTVMK